MVKGLTDRNENIMHIVVLNVYNLFDSVLSISLRTQLTTEVKIKVSIFFQMNRTFSFLLYFSDLFSKFSNPLFSQRMCEQTGVKKRMQLL